jgi:hypothetical protein
MHLRASYGTSVPFQQGRAEVFETELRCCNGYELFKEK